jgi:hypothetical protein
MIIGRAERVEAVAFYSRAQGLIELFNKLVLSVVWPVVLPVFAERAREEGGLRTVYLNAQAYLTGGGRGRQSDHGRLLALVVAAHAAPAVGRVGGIGPAPGAPAEAPCGLKPHRPAQAVTKRSA